MGFWNEERDELLRTMWAKKTMSSTMIAKELGAMSRSAVIGRAHRIGLPPKEGYCHRVRKSPANNLGLRDRYRAAKIVEARERIDTSLPADVTLGESEHSWRAEEPGDRRRRCELGDLRESSGPCHWPLSTFDGATHFFCGDPTFSSLPYCAHHAMRAVSFVPDARRSR